MLLVAMIVILVLSSSPNFFRFLNFDPFADARKYRPLIQTELAKYQLESYTNVVVALMQQESHGKGGDPMQASESAGVARIPITDPNQSIQVGVKHLSPHSHLWQTKKCRLCDDYPSLQHGQRVY